MGIQDVAGWALTVCRAANAGRALREIGFGTTRMRPGYAMPDVDTFLEEVAQATW